MKITKKFFLFLLFFENKIHKFDQKLVFYSQMSQITSVHVLLNNNILKNNDSPTTNTQKR